MPQNAVPSCGRAAVLPAACTDKQQQTVLGEVKTQVKHPISQASGGLVNGDGQLKILLCVCNRMSRCLTCCTGKRRHAAWNSRETVHNELVVLGLEVILDFDVFISSTFCGPSQGSKLSLRLLQGAGKSLLMRRLCSKSHAFLSSD